MRLLESEDCLEWAERKAGDIARGEADGDGDRRDEKRRSNGCSEVGRCGRSELCEIGKLLPGEESAEPYCR
jgi:hypothetical protein